MKVIKSEKTEIKEESDIVHARKTGRTMAMEIGFGAADCTKIATAISELARNIFLYAQAGTITVSRVTVEGQKEGVEVVAKDSGPGIDDVDLAMRHGYSTSNGLGIGLPGTKRVMDEFELETESGKGTSIRTVKWISFQLSV